MIIGGNVITLQQSIIDKLSKIDRAEENGSKEGLALYYGNMGSLY